MVRRAKNTCKNSHKVPQYTDNNKNTTKRLMREMLRSSKTSERRNERDNFDHQHQHHLQKQDNIATLSSASTTEWNLSSPKAS